MKQQITILFIFMLFTSITCAQSTWNYGTTSITANPTITKIGIGTTNPGAELHILDNGSGYNWNQLTLQSSNSSAGLTLINNSSTIWELQNVANSSSIAFYNRTNGFYGLTITNSGNIGIGTTSPSEKLEVINGNISIGSQYKKFIIHTQFWNQNSNFVSIAPFNNGNWDFNNGFFLFDNGQITKKISQDNIIAFNINRTTDNHDVFRIYSDGKVYATEINVKLSQNFPDYVFLEDYKLISLKETQDFISKNGHLPGIPSAKEIEENGNTINIGEMQILLLKKIEELTLHLIDLKSENDKLKEIIETSGLNKH